MEKMKRVALLRSNPKDFAYGRVAITLSKQYAVDCFLWDRQGDHAPFIHNENIKYQKCKLKGGFYDFRTLLKVLFFDLWLFWKLIFTSAQYIHAIDLDTGVVGLLVSKIKRKPFIYHCLDPYYANLPAGWPSFLGKGAKWIENIVISKSDLFIITDKLRIVQHAGANPTRVLEFANVPPVLEPEPQQDGRENGVDFVVGYIGSLIEGRNLVDIVETVGELQESGIRMVIGGFGPLEEEITKRARIRNNVSYVGWIPYAEVLRTENSFDVFIYTTDPVSESQKWVSPAKLFESMALGKPIVVSKDTLAAQRVALIGNGIAVEYGSKAALRDAILELKNDPGMTRQMGRRGKQEFERAWTYEIMEERLLEAYRELD
jgi:glycosyltransferase involved in cell wall biosynthesis